MSRIVEVTLNGQTQSANNSPNTGITLIVKVQGSQSPPSSMLEFTTKSDVAQLLIKFCTSTDNMLPSFFKTIVGTCSSSAPRVCDKQPLFCVSETVWAFAPMAIINTAHSHNNPFFFISST